MLKLNSHLARIYVKSFSTAEKYADRWTQTGTPCALVKSGNSLSLGDISDSRAVVDLGQFFAGAPSAYDLQHLCRLICVCCGRIDDDKYNAPLVIDPADLNALLSIRNHLLDDLDNPAEAFYNYLTGSPDLYYTLYSQRSDRKFYLDEFAAPYSYTVFNDPEDIRFWSWTDTLTDMIDFYLSR